MSTFQYTRPVPLRLVPSGTKSLNNGAQDIYLGLNALQKRYRLTIANRDAAKTLEVADSSGRILLPIFPQTAIPFQTDEDLTIVNNSGVAVSYNVLEEFFDIDQRGTVGGTSQGNGTGSGRSLPHQSGFGNITSTTKT